MKLVQFSVKNDICRLIIVCQSTTGVKNRFYYKTKQKYFILSFLIYQSIFTYSAHGYSTSRGAFLRFDRHFVTGDQIRTDTSFV